MICKGSCYHLCVKDFKKMHFQKYINGFKYCSICEKWFEHYLRCPCCNNKLRTRPRSHDSKQRFLARKTLLIKSKVHHFET